MLTGSMKKRIRKWDLGPKLTTKRALQLFQGPTEVTIHLISFTQTTNNYVGKLNTFPKGRINFFLLGVKIWTHDSPPFMEAWQEVPSLSKKKTWIRHHHWFSKPQSMVANGSQQEWWNKDSQKGFSNLVYLVYGVFWSATLCHTIKTLIQLYLIQNL